MRDPIILLVHLIATLTGMQIVRDIASGVTDPHA